MLSVSLITLVTAATALAGHVQLRGHNELARRAEGTLAKRFHASRITWYPTNTGKDACTGRNHQDSDFFIALNAPQWDNGAHCGKQVTITANGKTATGTIVDECADCPYGCIDLTKGFFQHFASLDDGVFQGNWQIGGGGGGGGGDGDDKPDPPKHDPKPKPPKVPKPPPPPKVTVPKPPPPPPKPAPPKEDNKPKDPPKEEKKKDTPKEDAKKDTPKDDKKDDTPKPSPPVSPPVVPTPATPTPETPTPDQQAANAGSNPDPSSSPDSSDILGGISSDNPLNGAVSAGVSTLFLGAAVSMILLAL